MKDRNLLGSFQNAQNDLTYFQRIVQHRFVILSAYRARSAPTILPSNFSEAPLIHIILQALSIS